jgi:hypothetical protein
MNYVVEVRGYWKVTRQDLENGLNHAGIEFPIDGSGAQWQDGSGVVVIRKGSDEWDYLYNHIGQLASFLHKNENTNSRSVPLSLKNCFRARP